MSEGTGYFDMDKKRIENFVVVDVSIMDKKNIGVCVLRHMGVFIFKQVCQWLDSDMDVLFLLSVRFFMSMFWCFRYDGFVLPESKDLYGKDK